MVASFPDSHTLTTCSMEKRKLGVQEAGMGLLSWQTWYEKSKLVNYFYLQWDCLLDGLMKGLMSRLDLKGLMDAMPTLMVMLDQQLSSY